MLPNDDRNNNSHAILKTLTSFNDEPCEIDNLQQIHSFPDELLTFIFSNIKDASSFDCILLVCKKWKEIISNETFWKQYCLKHWKHLDLTYSNDFTISTSKYAKLRMLTQFDASSNLFKVGEYNIKLGGNIDIANYHILFSDHALGYVCINWYYYENSYEYGGDLICRAVTQDYPCDRYWQYYYYEKDDLYVDINIAMDEKFSKLCLMLGFENREKVLNVTTKLFAEDNEWKPTMVNGIMTHAWIGFKAYFEEYYIYRYDIKKSVTKKCLEKMIKKLEKQSGLKMTQ